MTAQIEVFDQSRLMGLAYRITGSMTDAEDVIQDAWIRWQSRTHHDIRDPGGYLTRVVTNLSLDKLRAQKKERDAYVGSWLPEPQVENFPAQKHTDPQHSLELAEDLSIAFLLALESLSPSERVVFILHDVFAYSFNEVADILEREPASCRQLASRARKALSAGKRRYTGDLAKGKALATAFQQAIRDGDVAELTALLSDQVTFISDGGGKVAAVPKPVSGAAKVAKMLIGFAKTYADRDDLLSRFVAVNQLPGFVLGNSETIIQTVALDVNAQGLIEKIYVVRNPEKLRHLLA